MENILIIGAHYDDAELGAGGTAAKLVAEGKNVYKLTLTNNVTRSEYLNLNVEYEASKLNSAAACKVLGVKEITDFEPIECNRLTYDTDVMQRIEKVIYDYKIDTVFMHYMDDMNQDHIAASKLSLTASRHCQTVLAYQSNLYILSNKFYPTLFFDISDYVEKKRESLAQYTGDHNRNHKLFQTNINRNEILGYSNHCEYAEGFHVIKMLLK